MRRSRAPGSASDHRQFVKGGADCAARSAIGPSPCEKGNDNAAHIQQARQAHATYSAPSQDGCSRFLVLGLEKVRQGFNTMRQALLPCVLLKSCSTTGYVADNQRVSAFERVICYISCCKSADNPLLSDNNRMAGYRLCSVGDRTMSIFSDEQLVRIKHALLEDNDIRRAKPAAVQQMMKREIEMNDRIVTIIRHYLRQSDND
jgi:hypothetical protein